MPFFGKSRSVQAPMVDVNAAKAVETDFTENFKAWLSAVERAQVESNADALTPDILSGVGVIPVPQTGNPRLNRTQQIYLWSFARSFTGTMLEHLRIRASAATYQLEEAGGDSTRSRRAADFWAGVEIYARQTLG
jgi:hypothetical protein